MISITLDVDWVPSEVLSDTVRLLDRYDVPATVFSTHDDGVDIGRHERALHPNFYDAEDEQSVLEDLLDIYPSAVGIRSHGLYTHGRLQSVYSDLGLAYESNYIMYSVDGIETFETISGLRQIPLYFMDDFWFSDPDKTEDVDRLLGGDGLRVFGFHPIHIYLNTPDQAFYEAHKDDYQNPAALEDARYDGFGTRTLFIALLETIQERGHETYLLEEITDDTG